MPYETVVISLPVMASSPIAPSRVNTPDATTMTEKKIMAGVVDLFFDTSRANTMLRMLPMTFITTPV